MRTASIFTSACWMFCVAYLTPVCAWSSGPYPPLNGVSIVLGAYVNTSDPAMLQLLAQSGINTVLSYTYQDPMTPGLVYPAACQYMSGAQQSSCIGGMIDAMRLFVESANAAGLGAVVSFKDFYTFFPTAPSSAPAGTLNYAQVAGEVAAALIKEQGLYGYFINDEFDFVIPVQKFDSQYLAPFSDLTQAGIQISQQMLKSMSTSIRNADPIHPLMQDVDRDENLQMNSFIGTYDLVSTDAYPVGWAPYTMVSDSLHWLSDATQGSGATAFSLIQVSDQGIDDVERKSIPPPGPQATNQPPSTLYEPEARDEDCMIKLAQIHGSDSALFFYNASDFFWDVSANANAIVAATGRRTQNRFKNLSLMTQEVLSLAPALGAANSSENPAALLLNWPNKSSGAISAVQYGFGPTLPYYETAPNGNPLGAAQGIHFRTFTVQNTAGGFDYYLFVVNPSKDTSLKPLLISAEIKLQLTIPQGAALLPQLAGAVEGQNMVTSVANSGTYVSFISNSTFGFSGTLPSSVPNEVVVTSVGNNQYVIDANPISCAALVWHGQ